MKKCRYCRWRSDKRKNPNSKNKDKFIDDIEEGSPMLITRLLNQIDF